MPQVGINQKKKPIRLQGCYTPLLEKIKVDIQLWIIYCHILKKKYISSV